MRTLRNKKSRKPQLDLIKFIRKSEVFTSSSSRRIRSSPNLRVLLNPRVVKMASKMATWMISSAKYYKPRLVMRCLSKSYARPR